MIFFINLGTDNHRYNEIFGGKMRKFNEREFKPYLWKGQLHEAVDYLSNFPDKKELHQKYLKVFKEGEYYKRTDNLVISELDKIYQKYYRNVFWMKMPQEQTTKLLFQELEAFCEKHLATPNGETEENIKVIVNREGYECLCGITQGYFGPYIWKNSTKVTYEVELPNGIEPYQVIMMDGFISRSWLDFISFGMTGAGGWADGNGTLCCVRSVYDTSSESFNISFLKHEAQHAYDKKKYPKITSTDLEYRAKLVELIYYSTDEVFKNFFNEADNTNLDNGHAVAAYRIISNLSQKIFGCDYMSDENAWNGKLYDIKKNSRELLEESNQILEYSL